MALKLLVLSHVSDYIGGAERSLMDTIDVWRSHDDALQVEFIIRTPLGGMEKELEKRDIKYYPLDYTYWSDSNLPHTPDRIYNNSLRNMRAVESIGDIIKSTKPDVVLTNSIIAPWAAISAHFQGVPHAWMVREYGERDHGREFEIGEKATFEDIGNLSELVLTNSLTLAKFVEEYIDKDKIGTVYTPFNLELLKQRADEYVASPFGRKSQLKILMTGNITPGKGHDLVVRSIGEMKSRGADVEVCFIGREGDESYMEQLQIISKDLGVLDSVHYLGYKSNPLAYAKHADVAVMASRMEAFGRVTFEYIAAGLPVVGSNSGATPEIIMDGKNGLLYEANNAADLADKLMVYIDKPGLIDKHSIAATAHAEGMMKSEHSALQAYRRLSKLANAEKTKFKVLNYSKRWLYYPQDARDYMQYINSASLVDVLRFRAKTRLRPYYIHLKGLQSRLRSKIYRGR